MRRRKRRELKRRLQGPHGRLETGGWLFKSLPGLASRVKGHLLTHSYLAGWRKATMAVTPRRSDGDDAAVDVLRRWRAYARATLVI